MYHNSKQSEDYSMPSFFLPLKASQAEGTLKRTEYVLTYYFILFFGHTAKVIG